MRYSRRESDWLSRHYRDRQIGRFFGGKKLAVNLSVDSLSCHVKHLDDGKRLAHIRAMTWMEFDSVSRSAIHAHDIAVESK
jgi:hypothetical protein